MNLARAFRFAFDDAAWPTKVGVGAIVSLVPILNFAAVGYEVRVARRVAEGQDGELPTWDDLGAYFLDGGRLGLAQFLIALPSMLILCLPLFSAWLLLAASNETNPMDERTPAILLLCGAGLLLFTVSWLLLSLVSPAMVANYVRQGRFAACFDVRALARLIAADPGSYLTVVGTLMGLGIGGGLVIAPLSTILSIIPCLGYIAYLAVLGGFAFYVLLVRGHLVGQLLRATPTAAVASTGA